MTGIIRTANRSTGADILMYGGKIANVSRGEGSAPVAPVPALQLEFEGADASTAFTDLSPSARTVTANGSAQIDTDHFLTGSSSLYCPNNGSFAENSYVSVASDSVFTVSSGTGFELTASYRLPTSGVNRWFHLLATATGAPVIAIADRGGAMELEFYLSGGIYAAITAPVLTWHNVYVAKIGTQVIAEVNGTEVINETATGLPWALSSPGLQIGPVSSSQSAHWWIDNWTFTPL